MKLFVDDIRDAPEGWHLARTVTEAIRAIYYHDVTHISLDHDISHPVTVGSLMRPYPCEETYAPVAYFIGVFYEGKEKPHVTVHSANIIGAENIQFILSKHGINVDIKLSPPAYRPKGNTR